MVPAVERFHFTFKILAAVFCNIYIYKRYACFTPQVSSCLINIVFQYTNIGWCLHKNKKLLSFKTAPLSVCIK